MKMVDKNGLKVSLALLEFINNEAIPNTDINVDDFILVTSNNKLSISDSLKTLTMTKKFNIKCERKFEISSEDMVIGFVSKGCF